MDSFFVFSDLNADAKKVTKCLEDNGQEIINVLVSYYNSTTICFNPVLSKVIVSAQPILDHLDKADKKIGGYAPVLEKCANDLCVFGVRVPLFHTIRIYEYVFFNRF